MKKIIYIFISVLFISCNSENAPDCFQNAGAIIQQEFQVADFDKIVTFEKIELIVKDDPIQKVTVETGEYLLNDIDVSVENGQLMLRNNNGCNFTREYGITKVFVNSPNITEIRNGSGQDVRSDGVLSYSDLTLISEDFGVPEGFYRTDGNFYIQVNSASLLIIANSISHFFVSGSVEDANIRFFSGDSRFEGANLTAENVEVFHRSSNDMIINPQLSITGQIRSTGDVISLNQPSDISVEQFYTGKLIFQ